MSTFLPIDDADGPSASILKYVGALDSETVSIYCSDLKSRAGDWVRNSIQHVMSCFAAEYYSIPLSNRCGPQPPKLPDPTAMRIQKWSSV
jgi:hypothetical protein